MNQPTERGTSKSLTGWMAKIAGAGKR